MHKKYEDSYAKLQSSKEALLNQLSSCAPDILTYQNDNKWSALQHCYHIHLAEDVSLKYVIKKLSFQPELEDAGLRHQLRLSLIKIIEFSPFKFKAPELIAESAFPGDLSIESVTNEWNQSRVNLYDFLENVDDAFLNKEIYKQPLVGRLTIKGMLDFFQFHLDRHAGHIDRTLNNQS